MSPLALLTVLPAVWVAVPTACPAVLVTWLAAPLAAWVALPAVAVAVPVL